MPSRTAHLVLWSALALGFTVLGCDKGPEEPVVENLAPVAAAGKNISTAADGEVSLDGRGSYDPEGDTLWFTWEFESVPPGSALGTRANPFSNNRDQGGITSFHPDRIGVYVVSLVVTDGRLSSEPSYVVIDATEPNDRPIAHAGEDQTVSVGTEVVVDGAGSTDPLAGRNGPLSYSWAVVSVPFDSSIDTADLDRQGTVARFRPDVGGEYTLSLVVDNGMAGSMADEVLILVTSANGAPVADAGPDQVIATGSTASLDAGASHDPEGDALAFFWELQGKPDGSTATNDSFADRTAASTTFLPDLAGTYVLGVSVFDGAAWSAPDSLTLEVGDFPPHVLRVGSTMEGGEGRVTSDVGGLDCRLGQSSMGEGTCEITLPNGTRVELTAVASGGSVLKGFDRSPPDAGCTGTACVLTLLDDAWVRVGFAQAPGIESFTATPALVARGGEAQLSWSTRGLSGCTIEPGAIVVTGSVGSVGVVPETTTEYTFACGESLPTASATVTVVSNEPPTSRFLAPASSSITIEAGDSVTFTGACTDDAAGGDTLLHHLDFGTGAEPRWSSTPDGNVVTYALPGVYAATYDCTDVLGAATVTPAQVTVTVTEPAFARVVGGSEHTCGLTQSGRIYCWGNNFGGRLGTGGPGDVFPRPVRVGARSDWVRLEVGGDLSCAIDAQHALHCWGRSDNGVGDGSGIGSTTPRRLDTANDWQDVSVGGTHACATRTDGSLYCFGTNSEGALGVGDTAARTGFTRVGLDDDWVDVSAGDHVTCAIKTGDRAFCWGLNSTNAVGDGTTTRRTTPVEIGSNIDWQTVSAARSWACGVSVGHELYCWGDDSFGQLGDGAKGLPRTTAPARVGAATDWASVSTGFSHTCARKLGGTIHCWGNALFGQLGQGNQVESAVPLPVGLDADWSSVEANVGFTCGVRAGGTAWCFGHNVGGTLGNGTASSPDNSGNDAFSPVRAALVP